MEIYKKNSQPPKWALRHIQAGRLKGKTDINPQWRYEALTDTFGLCGIGWKYEVKRTWLENGANNEITANAEILLFIKYDGEWSNAIPGVGGASFVSNEKNGMYTSDECYKMAITDALSVACKMLGIGSAIYAGKWDGSKYKTDVEQKQQPKQEQKTESRELTLSEVNDKWNGKIYKGNVVYIDKVQIEVNDEQLKKLKEHSKYKAE